MKVFTTVKELQQALQQEIKNKKSIGFVPTMGALHKGHLALIKQAKTENDIAVSSIFVNPIQFNNQEDLKKYPRTLEQDLALLEEQNCDYVFTPNENEIYPEKPDKVFDFGMLDKVMEGKFRPGHFNGVALVVERLFNIVQPDKAYFGEKDFQQLAIIQQMVKDCHLPVQIIPYPIVREDDGLAMSSRNMRLSAQARSIAPYIYKILTIALDKKQKERASVTEVQNFVIQNINSIPEFTLEYFEIVNARTLQQIMEWDNVEGSIGCITVWLNNVRLIDNIRFA